MSFPFQGRKLTFTQPDGASIDVVGWGDQHEAVFETTGGYTIVPDADRIYRYAILSPGGALCPTAARADRPPPDLPGLVPGLRAPSRRTRGFGEASRGFTTGQRRCEQRWEARQIAARDASRAPPARGTIGTYRGLCLLVRFPDVPATISRQEVESFCNLPGYSGFGNAGSVRDYFLESSRGRFDYTNSVTEYYTATHPRSYYTDENVPDGKRARELITEALKDLKARGFDFSSLSVDSQGYVYALNVFYAGPCVNNWPKGLWPHSWSLAEPLQLGSGGRRAVFDYQITNVGSELTLATFCHENGHMICDFPDLYDYGYESFGAGNYCLMAFGGGDPKNPVNICAYLRYKAGWIAKVTPIADGMAAELAADGSEALLFARTSSEYFLVENRFKKGRDASLPASGLAVWHVDERGSNNNEQMTAANHYECTLVQADNQWGLERKKNQGDAADLFSAAAGAAFSDTTSPSARWWSGAASNLKLRDISAPGERMTLRAGEAKGEPPILGEVLANLAIPDSSAAGVKSTLALQSGPADRVGGVEVDVQIRHSYRGDLRVSLVSPSGTAVLLHDRAGGGADDLRARFDLTTTPALKALTDEPIAGTWTLAVQDLAGGDTGTLERWSLGVTRVPTGHIVLAEEPGATIPDDDPAGIARTLACTADARVGQMEVRVEITHTYVGDLEVSLTSPSGTLVVLHNRSGGSEDNLFETFTVTSHPDLAAFAGQPARGNWTLKVADRAGQDVGKLARWSLQLG